jgi:hypothetical protein
LSANGNQAAETPTVGHVQVEQHQIGIGCLFQFAEELHQTGSLIYYNCVDRMHNCLTQRGAKKRVVVSDKQKWHRHNVG